MKNTLAENMLRFGAKNLSEESKRKLAEQGEPVINPNDPKQFQAITVKAPSKLAAGLKGKTFPLDNFMEKQGLATLVMHPNNPNDKGLALTVNSAKFIPGTTDASGNRVSDSVILNVGDGRFVNFDLRVFKDSARLEKLYKTIDGINVRFTDGAVLALDDSTSGGDLQAQLSKRENFDNNSLIKRIQTALV